MDLMLPRRICRLLVLGMGLLLWTLTACTVPGAYPPPTALPAGHVYTSSPLQTVQPSPKPLSSGDESCPAQSPLPTLNAASPATQSTSPELTYEENLRINPPPPANLWAVASEKGIFLCWQAPPVVVGSAYGEKPHQYRIYRRGAGGEKSFLTQAVEIHYLDASAVAGVEYTYTVSGVYDNGFEGARSSEVRVTKP